ncbi:NTP transferase domain-containing protein [Nakamurella sp. YIM 132087]|uniref:NTP transferase domain-containing protein n=1 Tax=Nakamurella alba TaxID=2665158 RepID=A0A7K1FIE5_9ACTN|nr:sugar phosphate nucleotidyltransferase [Nakamurella alba]MTD12664.1 NTP transferase domain-containing protein [Nakamurella alba]
MTTVPEPAGVVLAAGRGSRMSPLTDVVPKPLLTVGNVSLLELAIRRMERLTSSLAVNAHHLADQIAAAAGQLHPGIEVSFERERLLGTAGALWQLRDWIDGRPVVVANSDVWLQGPVDQLLEGWDGRRPRLLVKDMGRPADFGTLRFLGVSTVPADVAARLGPDPDGLYAAVWKNAHASGGLEFVEVVGEAHDCGTPAEFLTANQLAAGTDSVVAPDAVVEGTIREVVLLPGARVAAGEHLERAIRDACGHTLDAGDTVRP